MSFFTIEDFLILDEGSEVLKKQFENHCDWCWGAWFWQMRCMQESL